MPPADLAGDHHSMSTPRRLRFSVGSSLLTATLTLAGGCDEQGKGDPGPTANPAPEQQPQVVRVPVASNDLVTGREFRQAARKPPSSCPGSTAFF